MNIQQSYNLIVYILRKERNGFVSIDDFNQIAPQAQLDVLRYYCYLYPGVQKWHDAISPFKQKYNFTPSLSPLGVITLPADYVHLMYGYTIVSGSKRQIVFPEEDEQVAAEMSQLRPVTINYPLGSINAGVIQLTPEQGQTGRIWYIREPLTPLYSVTIVGRVITYVPGSSQDFEFDNIYQIKIIASCLTYFSVNLSDDKVFQYSLLKDKEAE